MNINKNVMKNNVRHATNRHRKQKNSIKTFKKSIINKQIFKIHSQMKKKIQNFKTKQIRNRFINNKITYNNNKYI